MKSFAPMLSFPVNSYSDLVAAVGKRKVPIGRREVLFSQLDNMIPPHFFPFSSEANFSEKLEELSQNRDLLSSAAVPLPVVPRGGHLNRSLAALQQPLAGTTGSAVPPGLEQSSLASPNVWVEWQWHNQSKGVVKWVFGNPSSQQRSMILFRNGYYYGDAFWPIYIQEGFSRMTSVSALGHNLLGAAYQQAPLALVHFGGQAYIVAFVFTLASGEVWGTYESGFNGVGGQPNAPSSPIFVVEVAPEGGANSFCLQYDPQHVSDFAGTASNVNISSSPGYSPNPNIYDFVSFAPVLPGSSTSQGYWQDYPGDLTQLGGCGWKGWLSLGAPAGTGIGGAPAVSSWAPGRLDVFVCGTDNALWHCWLDNTNLPSYLLPLSDVVGWSNWETLWGDLTSDPAAVSWGKGRMDVFAVGPDNALRHIYYDASLKGYEGGWQDWESLGAPGVAAWNGTPLRIDDDPWPNLSPPGGYGVGSKPAAVTWGQGNLKVFVFATVQGSPNLDLWSLGFANGAWDKQWENVTGQVPLPGDTFVSGSGPAAVSWGPNRYDIIAEGNNAFWHLWGNPNWQNWDNLSSIVGTPIVDFPQPASPAVSSWAQNRLDVFAVAQPMGHQGGCPLWHLWFDGSWEHWEALGGQYISDPAAISFIPGRIDVFGQGSSLDLKQLMYF
jgi:hypothetical protein